MLIERILRIEDEHGILGQSTEGQLGNKMKSAFFSAASSMNFVIFIVPFFIAHKIHCDTCENRHDNPFPRVFFRN